MIKNWKVFTESKNYADVYHSIRKTSTHQTLPILTNILQKGIEFKPDTSKDILIKRAQRLGEPKPFPFFKDDEYYICVSRNREYGKDFQITFVLDASAISERWKIEPYNLAGPEQNLFYRNAGKDFSKMSDIEKKKFARKLYAEEKICSRKPEYLPISYIKEIIVRKADKFILDEIDKWNSTGIKVTIE